MSGDALWWTDRARQLEYGQLDAVRKQAESWRTGLTGVTALIGAVLVVKGKDDFTRLDTAYAVLVPVLLGLALLALLTATVAALRAAAGAPKDDILLNGENLKAWTETEVGNAQRAIRLAQLLTAVGVVLILGGAVLTWFAPAKPADTPLVRVDVAGQRFCGKLLQQDGSVLRIGEQDLYRIVPITGPVTVETVKSC
ncbi:hypothetical protein [Actinoplanes sp. L3-i22]|uniref:hypothetical protein n=1 Tax=Actinoplanes sp. L3-i22 TaxID=2836373 RepID=UPI001C795A34|nr:hypothetical protein [Actinoplanes sp. L3-i22]BCY08269.1 hypothetical protein L3i22_033570 [Actinoplanes sp. L3-i22]